MLCSWLIYKQKHVLFIIGTLLFGMLSYAYVGAVIPQPAKEGNVTNLTWTDVYRINGSYIRGFAISDENEKWYVQLKIKSEQEKLALMNTSLAGMIFKVDAKEVPKRPMSHQYAFEMDQYIKSNGAVGQIQVEQYEVIGKVEGFLAYMAEKRFKMKQHIQKLFLCLCSRKPKLY